jgi:hypothetical protein
VARILGRHGQLTCSPETIELLASASVATMECYLHELRRVLVCRRMSQTDPVDCSAVGSSSWWASGETWTPVVIGRSTWPPWSRSRFGAPSSVKSGGQPGRLWFAGGDESNLTSPFTVPEIRKCKNQESGV